MCVVSVIVDASREQWPAIRQQLPSGGLGGGFNQWEPPQPQWSKELLQKLDTVIKMLAEIDSKMGAKDCYDPKKEAFIKDIKEKLAELEA